MTNLVQLLTAGTESAQRQRPDGSARPALVVLAPAAYRPGRGGSPRQDRRCVITRRGRDASRHCSCYRARSRRHPVVRAEAWQGQAFHRSGVDRECRVLVASGRSTTTGNSRCSRSSETADTPPAVKQKAEFAVQLMIDALAPTNFASGKPGGDQEGAWTPAACLWRKGRATSFMISGPIAVRRSRSFRARTPSARTWPSHPARLSSATT